MKVIAVARRHLKLSLRFVIRPVPASIVAALFNFAVCYFSSFVLLNVPLVLWGDQVGFYNAGSRVVLGQLPYRDYFQIVPPGTDLTYALLIKHFGLQLWIPNLLMACLVAMTALLMTLIASHLMRGPVILLPGLLLAGIILPASMDATHHWFSTIAVLAAVLVLLKETTLPRIAAAGALCGLAACFTQTKGALAIAGFTVYLIYGARRHTIQPPKRWQEFLLLYGAAAAVFMVINAYFIRAAGIGQWLFHVLIYPLRYYSYPSVNNWRVLIHDFPEHNGIWKWVTFPFLYATVPLVSIMFVVTIWRRWEVNRDKHWRKLLLVAIAGIAMFMAIAAAPSIKRLGTVSPPTLILLAWLLHRPGKTATRLKLLLACVAIALAVAIPVRIQTKTYVFLDLPAGRGAFKDTALCEEYRWLLENTHPGQFFFGLPPLYFAFHMRNPAAIEGFISSEYTRPQQIFALVEALESHPVPLLILRRSHDFLFTKDSPSDHLEPIRVYVTRNYQLTKTFPTGDEVWRRIGAPVPVVNNKDADAPAKAQDHTSQ
ncbi:MAG TPA: hypothetical protein VNY78_01760 [Edaphobacter sp.]|nr:hypothetical protein [Edaphobacter sp.]